MANLFQSLGRGASNVIRRGTENMMPEPVGGLLTKEDVARARRSGMLHLGLSLLGDTSGMGLGPALAQAIPAGQQAYKGAAQDVMAQRGALRDERNAERQEQSFIRQEQEAIRQQALLQTRNAITAKYKLGPDATPQQIFASFPKMYADLMAAGDMEGAKNLQGVVQQMLPKDKQGMTVDGRAITFDPESGEFTMGPDIPMSADRREQADLDRRLKLATIEAQRAGAAASREAAAAARVQTQGAQIGKAFLSQNRKTVEREAAYAQWSAALEGAKMGDPAAFKSAIVNFINIADPGAQIRLGVLQFLSKLDPSGKGMFTMKRDELMHGRHPRYLLESMERHVDKIHTNEINLYRHRREARLNALGNPAYEAYIPTAEELFPSASKAKAVSDGATAPEGRGSSRVNEFLGGGAQPIAAPYSPMAPRLDPNAGSFFPRR